jgi:uncharacterized protein (TIGR03083 family)
VVKALTKHVDGLLEQSRTVLSWLGQLTDADFARPSVLPEWDVRMLTGHLVLVHAGLLRLLDAPSTQTPVTAAVWVRRYRRDVDQIALSTARTTADKSGAELVSELGHAVDGLATRLIMDLPAVLDAPRGPSSLADFLSTRVVEVVVHADDLSRSLPDREPIALHRRAMSITSRTLTAILVGQHPGRSIEVRIPPFAAVQCGIGDPGPTHTRGTPPNVVETDAITFARLATGRVTWAEAVQTGRVSASGLRADLSESLPLLS